ncbi:MAG TPA: hypothetical protein VJR02_09200 [Pyrinomonadaceae bacterium]|nr:hypothetical protein [Pyrinomonadaceae bacterium]
MIDQSTRRVGRLFVTLWRLTIRGLLDLVRRAEAGESVVDDLGGTQTCEDSSEEKIEALARMICRAGDEAGGEVGGVAGPHGVA